MKEPFPKRVEWQEESLLFPHGCPAFLSLIRPECGRGQILGWRDECQMEGPAAHSVLRPIPRDCRSLIWKGNSFPSCTRSSSLRSRGLLFRAGASGSVAQLQDSLHQPLFPEVPRRVLPLLFRALERAEISLIPLIRMSHAVLSSPSFSAPKKGSLHSAAQSLQRGWPFILKRHPRSRISLSPIEVSPCGRRRAGFREFSEADFSVYVRAGPLYRGYSTMLQVSIPIGSGARKLFGFLLFF